MCISKARFKLPHVQATLKSCFSLKTGLLDPVVDWVVAFGFLLQQKWVDPSVLSTAGQSLATAPTASSEATHSLECVSWWRETPTVGLKVLFIRPYATSSLQLSVSGKQGHPWTGKVWVGKEGPGANSKTEDILAEMYLSHPFTL